MLFQTAFLDAPLNPEPLRIAVYMTTVGSLFPLLAAVYLHVCSGRATHSVPAYTAPEPQSVTEPFECRSDGSFDFCVKDNCKMRWKPPGTHHCSVCGVCRLGFDHHCPWVSVVRCRIRIVVRRRLVMSAGELSYHETTESFSRITCFNINHRTSC